MIVWNCCQILPAWTLSFKNWFSVNLPVFSLERASERQTSIVVIREIAIFLFIFFFLAWPRQFSHAFFVARCHESLPCRLFVNNIITEISFIFLCYFYHQSILNIGAMIGGPLGGWVIDFFGRKLALMITALPFSAGWLMIGFGSNEVLLHAGRFLSGLGVGMASLIVPVSKYVQTWKQSLTNFCLSS